MEDGKTTSALVESGKVALAASLTKLSSASVAARSVEMEKPP